MSDVLSLADTIQRILDETEGQEDVFLRDLLDSFDSRSYGPVILVPSLFALTPLGAIPVVPTILAVFVLLLAVQLAVGRTSPWIPKVLQKRSVGRARLKKAADKAKPWTRKIEKVTRPRLAVLTRPPAPRIIGLMCCVLAALMPPLEIVPFAVFIPAAGLTCLSLALTSKDGLLVIVGTIFTVSTIGGGWWLL